MCASLAVSNNFSMVTFNNMLKTILNAENTRYMSCLHRKHTFVNWEKANTLERIDGPCPEGHLNNILVRECVKTCIGRTMF